MGITYQGQVDQVTYRWQMPFTYKNIEVFDPIAIVAIKMIR